MRQCIWWIASFASVLVSMFLPSTALADARNGAEWYRRAFVERQRLTEADWDALDTYRGTPHEPPSAAVREAIRRAGPALELARRGSEQAYADFELKYEDGIEMLMPHLAQLRIITKLQHADVLVHLHDGDIDTAAEIVASMYRMAEHLRYDDVLISSLVTQAIFSFTDDAARAGFDRGAFGAEAAGVMYESVSAFDARDPFRFGEAVAAEQTIFVGALVQHFGDRERLADMLEWSPADGAQTLEFMALSEASLLEEVGKYDQMMDDVVEIFFDTGLDAEVGAERIRLIGEAIEAGEHGLVASVMSPGWDRVYGAMLEARTLVGDQQALLRGMMVGEVAPDAQVNAALYYVNAIDRLHASAWPVLAPLVDARVRRGLELDDVTRLALDDATPVVDELRAGSTCQRCAFEVIRTAWPPRLCHSYVAGMNEAIAFLHVDAIRLLQAGDVEGATDRAAIAYRMVAHLCTDEPIMSALVAHRQFDRTNRLVDEIVAATADDAATQAAMLETLRIAADAIPRQDPFGYIGSVRALRTWVTGRLRRLRYRGVLDKAAEAQLAERIATWRVERLVSLLAVYDTLARASAADPARLGGDDPVRRIPGAVDLDRLAALRGRVPELAPRIAAGDLEIFGDRGFVGLSNLDAAMANARADLRAGLSRYRSNRRVLESTGSDRP